MIGAASVFFTVLLSVASASSVKVCGEAMAVRPLSELTARVTEHGLRVFIVADDGPPDGREYVLAVRRDGEHLGNLLILRDSEASGRIYQSHAMLVSAARGLGIGTLLYVLAAEFVHRNGGTLQSSDVAGQEPAATALWTRMVDYGWAEYVPGRSRFRIRPELLTGGVFDSLRPVIENRSEVEIK